MKHVVGRSTMHGCVIAILAAIGCEAAPNIDPRAALTGFGQPEVERWQEDPAWTLRPVRRYGELEGPLAFGYIMSLAVRDDGVLAVADYQTCTVTLLSRPDGKPMQRIGACGDGPGEFRQIRSIAFVGDSLVVYDQGRGDIAVLAGTGDEVSRVRVRLPPGSAIWQMSPLGAGAIAVSIESPSITPALEDDEGRNPRVGILDLGTGEVREWLAFDPELARIGSPNALRRLASCSNTTAEGSTLVIFNPWTYEGVGVSLPRRYERFHFVTRVPMEPIELESGSWRPGGMITAAVWCGANAAVFRDGKPAPLEPSSTQRAQESYIEARDYSGQVLMRTTVSDSASVLVRGTFGTMHGSSLFIAVVGEEGYPEVTELEFVRER